MLLLVGVFVVLPVFSSNGEHLRLCQALGKVSGLCLLKSHLLPHGVDWKGGLSLILFNKLDSSFLSSEFFEIIESDTKLCYFSLVESLWLCLFL